jgi:hemin uptake protein HemP
MNPKGIGLTDDVLAQVAEHPESQARAAISRRMTSTRELLGGGMELQIEHNGEIYTLRQTSKGKLILTK